MKAITLILICTCNTCFGTSPIMKEAKQDAEELGKRLNLTAFSEGENFPIEEITSQKNKKFDVQLVLKDIENQNRPNSGVLDFLTSKEVLINEKDNKGFDPDEFFLHKSELIVSQKNIPEITEKNLEETLERCTQSGDPYPISFVRTLEIEMTQGPPKTRSAKICQGHSDRKWYLEVNAKDANKIKEKKEKKLSEDPNILSYSVEVKFDPKSYSCIRKVRWAHVDDYKKCDNCIKGTRVIGDGEWVESGEHWVYDSDEWQKYFNNPEHTLISQICLDETPVKIINGKSINRKCWKEQLTFLNEFPKNKDCDRLKKNNCELVNKKCLHDSPFGCSLWELTFKCFSKVSKSRHFTQEDLFGSNQDEWSTEYEPNHSFADAVSTLSIFAEIQKEIGESKEFNLEKLKIFDGSKKKCSKSIADNIFYDCCYSYSGLAKKAGLAKCSSDEIALADMKEKGLCHYVGSYEKTVLNIKKSDEHVYCCYGSKLARVIQEGGRKQLGIKWGKPKDPDCRGFSIDEISKIDFTRLDLTELCEDYAQKLPADIDQKLQTFHNRLTEKIEQYQLEAEAKL